VWYFFPTLNSEAGWVLSSPACSVRMDYLLTRLADPCLHFSSFAFYRPFLSPISPCVKCPPFPKHSNTSADNRFPMILGSLMPFSLVFTWNIIHPFFFHYSPPWAGWFDPLLLFLEHRLLPFLPLFSPSNVFESGTHACVRRWTKGSLSSRPHLHVTNNHPFITRTGALIVLLSIVMGLSPPFPFVFAAPPLTAFSREPRALPLALVPSAPQLSSFPRPLSPPNKLALLSAGVFSVGSRRVFAYRPCLVGFSSCT